MCKYFLVGVLILCASVTVSPLFGRSAQGVSLIKLTTPVNAEITARAKKAATDSLRIELYAWINENVQKQWDIANPVRRAHVAALLDKCLPSAEITSKIELRDWYYTIALSQEQIVTAITQYNQICDSMARGFYAQAVVAESKHDYSGYYSNLVQSLFNAYGHVGDSLLCEPDSTKLLIPDALERLTALVHKLSFFSPSMVVVGKPGSEPSNNCAVKVLFDSIPLHGVSLCVILPSGKKVAMGKTDAGGQLGLNSMTIPYVVNGSFLYVKLDPASQCGDGGEWRLKNLGVTGTVPDHMLMFKISAPLCAIHYAVNAVSDLAIPPDFATASNLEKFLRDSCNMRIAGPSDLYDLVFDVTVQISRYEHDASSETRCKTEGSIMIQPVRHAEKALVKQGIIFEKAYETGRDIPYGAFFWESAGRLRTMIRSMLNDI